jgi:hypothetical protein
MVKVLLLLGCATLVWSLSYNSLNLSDPLCTEVFGFDLLNSTPIAEVEASVQVGFALTHAAGYAFVLAVYNSTYVLASILRCRNCTL